MGFTPFQIIKNMGFRYTIYRVRHELEKRLGVLEKRHPSNVSPKFFTSLDSWRSNNTLYFQPENIVLKRERNAKLNEDFQKIKRGEICFFNHKWKMLGLDYDWLTNPETGFKYDKNTHWSKINDFSSTAGDIKYVWEKSRFSWILVVLRHDYHFQEDHSDFVFSEIESWIDTNSVNKGPNWRCSQEISLRLFNWYYVLCYYKNSPNLTEKRWGKIQNVIYWSLHHVYHHIDFSRIAVRNNHAITETLMLSLSNLLFPFISDTEMWATNGRKWFEQEIAYQIYEDGTFLQFSMNYHRVVVQLLSLGVSIAEWKNVPFAKVVYDRAYKSLNFLYQCIQEENGFLPNYGANDGALFFPLTNCGYRDYRPQLNTLHKLLTGRHIYPSQTHIAEDSYWTTLHHDSRHRYKFDPIEKHKGVLSFKKGGYYLLRENDLFMLIRCGRHKDRPGHADNLHLDVWCRGINVLRDSGTYKYNTTKEFQDYFSGTRGHNTVMIGSHSQMQKGSRFIWYYWSQAKGGMWEETNEAYTFKGTISAFRFLNPKVTHHRVIRKEKGKNMWTVYDMVENAPDLLKFQLWHHDRSPINITANENGNVIEGEAIESYNSDFYGSMLKGKGTSFRFKNNIITKFALED
ncbi:MULTISPECIES: alginate lyase family protein [Olivibacter]|jgi:hypothetical protein|uniref:Alginate lyase family protein n=1 Tax=Olivibacter oleidegradans TaxID=760123 RepID=A0ABV6HJ09_9SPHI|nr:alginate lyase family protein [Olivibacter jilunii]